MTVSTPNYSVQGSANRKPRATANADIPGFVSTRNRNQSNFIGKGTQQFGDRGRAGAIKCLIVGVCACRNEAGGKECIYQYTATLTSDSEYTV